MKKINFIELRKFIFILSRVRFNKPIPLDLTAVVMAEYSAVMELSKSGQISVSYSPK